jgi:guanyl-specific ribonuclease Sa
VDGSFSGMSADSSSLHVHSSPSMESEDAESLAQLARKVLVVNGLPYESRVRAMVAWLQIARGLGPQRYNECVKLAVTLLMRRNAGKVSPCPYSHGIWMQ